MQNDIQEKLTALVSRCLEHLGWLEEYKENIPLDLPTDNRFGDFTVNIALKLSKILKRSPQLIAAELVDCLEKEKIGRAHV